MIITLKANCALSTSVIMEWLLLPIVTISLLLMLIFLFSLIVLNADTLWLMIFVIEHVRSHASIVHCHLLLAIDLWSLMIRLWELVITECRTSFFWATDMLAAVMWLRSHFFINHLLLSSLLLFWGCGLRLSCWNLWFLLLWHICYLRFEI